MKLLADANVPRQLVVQLRGLGHDVIYAAEREPAVTDEAWLDLAGVEQGVLITDDKDFGELSFRRSPRGLGVVLLRLFRLPLRERVEWLAGRWDVILKHPDCFVVVSEKKMRVRRREAKS